MDCAAIEYKKRLSSLVIPVTSTPAAGSMLFRLVRGMGLFLILGMGVRIWVEKRVGVSVRRNIGRFEMEL